MKEQQKKLISGFGGRGDRIISNIVRSVSMIGILIMLFILGFLITNGMPVVFRTALKPTASISREQRTVDIQNMDNAELEIKGRHDPCIVQRAVPVVEAVAAIGLLDLMMEAR